MPRSTTIFFLSRLQRQDGNLTAVVSQDREEHFLAARQDVRHSILNFALVPLEDGHTFRLSPGSREAEEAFFRCEDNHIFRPPTPTPLSGNLTKGQGRSSRDGYLPHLAIGNKGNEFAI